MFTFHSPLDIRLSIVRGRGGGGVRLCLFSQGLDSDPWSPGFSTVNSLSRSQTYKSQTRVKSMTNLRKQVLTSHVGLRRSPILWRTAEGGSWSPEIKSILKWTIGHKWQQMHLTWLWWSPHYFHLFLHRLIQSEAEVFHFVSCCSPHL